jgi:hypothetical protein
MNISATIPDERVEDVRFTDTALVVELKDGRKISAPLSWFPRLASASPETRAKWELSAAGYGIHWSLIDEDLSVEGLLRGSAAPAA